MCFLGVKKPNPVARNPWISPYSIAVKKLLILLLLLCSIACPLSAQEPNTEPFKPDVVVKGQEIPPAVKIYKGRSVAQTMHYAGAGWLIRAVREREESAEEMIKQLGIKPGQVLCDLGCGNGFHTLKMAELTGEKGVVYGVDIQVEMLRMLKDRAGKSSIKNIKTVHAAYHDPGLPANTFDLILLVDVYHEFSHPDHLLKAMRKSLKPNGRIALVEYREEDPEVPIKPLHKMSKKQILKEFLPAGFKLVGEYDKLPWQHLMFFSPDEKKD
jgi:ubiquinone/menaquinone biosynthesis C-methylase UbiE